jgi:hypothetical protein
MSGRLRADRSCRACCHHQATHARRSNLGLDALNLAMLLPRQNARVARPSVHGVSRRLLARSGRTRRRPSSNSSKVRSVSELVRRAPAILQPQEFPWASPVELATGAVPAWFAALPPAPAPPLGAVLPPTLADAATEPPLGDAPPPAPTFVDVPLVPPFGIVLPATPTLVEVPLTPPLGGALPATPTLVEVPPEPPRIVALPATPTPVDVPPAPPLGVVLLPATPPLALRAPALPVPAPPVPAPPVPAPPVPAPALPAVPGGRGP